MALFKFVKNILEDKPIDVYNYGNMQRDFTYIEDIIEGIVRVIDNPPKENKNWQGNISESTVPYKIYNIGNGSPVKLMDFIKAIEEILGKKAKKNLLPMQLGDVDSTYADTTDLEKDLYYKPYTPIKEGVARFIEWYKWYFKV